MKELEKPRAKEITRLHNEIVGHLRQSLDKAIRIGELLTDQKEGLQHGEWLPWIEQHLPFSDQTARNYMRLYRHKKDLKIKNVLNLAEAYKLLLPKEPRLKMDDVDKKWGRLDALQSLFDEIDSIEDLEQRQKAIVNVIDKGQNLQEAACHLTSRAVGELVLSLIGTENLYGWAMSRLETDYYKMEPTGLTIKREFNEEAWIQYGLRLAEVGAVVNEVRRYTK